MSAAIDLTGERFGRLTVIARATNAKSRGVRWHCRCECGKETIVAAADLRRGQSRSCGCLHSEVVTFMGRRRRPTTDYERWDNLAEFDEMP